MENVAEKSAKSRLINMIIILVPIIVLLAVIFLILNRSDYEKIERQMVKNAKEYVNKNNIKVTNQEFVFIHDLEIDSGVELCSKASGVVITNIGGSIKYYPYLKCVDYESKILNNTKSYIELNGSDVALVNLGTLYFDAGYTKKRDDIKVETVGIVPNEVGAYTINYVVTKDGKQRTIVKRIVIVSDVDTAIVTNGFDNKEEPNIILKGEAEMVLKLNEKYEEPGYAAYDYTDGYLTRKVSVEPKNISTDKVGTYVITYSVKNSKGKVSTATRKVSVVKEIGDLKVELSTAEHGSAINESSIEIHVSGADFEKIILPDGMITTYTIATYKAKSNGIYTFKVVDKYKNEISKSIVVDNIDSKAPTGSCVVESGETENIIKVTAEDDRGVMSVNYIINGYESGFFEATSYRTKEKIAVASAIIKDVAGNTTRVSCKIDNKVTQDDNYTFKYDNNKKKFSCDSYSENDKRDLESKLVQAINNVGYGTRAAVVEAARFLVGGLNYTIPYLGLKNETIDPERIMGLYTKVGLNIANSNGWGCKVNGLTQGMDKSSFIKWAFINAGVTLVDDYATTKTSDNINKIKPGDLLLTSCKESCDESNKYSDLGIVIGIDSNKMYVAEVSTSNGLIITELDKKKMPSDGKFAMVSLYNYESEGKLTNMWK